MNVLCVPSSIVVPGVGKVEKDPRTGLWRTFKFFETHLGPVRGIISQPWFDALMEGLTDAEEANVLEYYTGGVAMASADASTFVSLFSTNPSDAGSGATEHSWAGYARVNFTNNQTNWSDATGTAPTVVSNDVAIAFSQKTDAGSVSGTGFGIHSAVTAGSLRLFGALSPTVSISQNDTPSFAIGALDHQLGDPGDTY